MTALREPFEITHDKGGFTYVSWSQVADRLDEVAPDGWSFEIIELRGESMCIGRLHIGNRHFDNTGYAENADADWKKEPAKDAVSDAFKRCAALAGVARYLYDKENSVTGTGRAVAPPPARPAARPTVVPDDPYADLPPAWEGSVPVDPRDGGACPVHGSSWTLKPAGVSKAGKPYDAFWKCDGRYDDGSYCKEKPPKAWAARHEG